VSSQTAARARKWFVPKASLLAAAVGLLALSGCGSSSSSTSSATSTPASTATTTASSGTSSTPAPAASSGAGTIPIAANPEGMLKFEPATATAKAGKATISFNNSASIEHNLTIASPSGGVLAATPTFAGGSKTLSVTLKPGVYKFYCTIPGHRQGGMEGTLTVQ
jgi:plastocyanin